MAVKNKSIHNQSSFKKAGLVKKKTPASPLLDTAEYDRRIAFLNHTSTSTIVHISSAPAHKTLYPKAGAILPFRRVVAYYGNYHSKKMGIIGEYPEDEVLRRLKVEIASWNAADPSTPVLPAIHYVAVTAQGSAGSDGKFRLRMADTEIEKVLSMANKAGAIVFLDIQIGKSTVESEVPHFEKYLKMPQVHLGLDPEFSMKGDANPGQKIGTMDAAEINWAVRYLSNMVDKYHLPPKVLVIHRFIPAMVTNIRHARPTSQVQIVINVDGWGTPEEKTKTYQLCIKKDAVQFAGFKVFYKNDLRKSGSRLMTPTEILQLSPKPIYIQYQ